MPYDDLPYWPEQRLMTKTPDKAKNQPVVKTSSVAGICAPTAPEPSPLLKEFMERNGIK